MADEGVDESKRATLQRFAALGAASPLTRFKQGADSDSKDSNSNSNSNSNSDSDTPDAIAGYVAATPGAHFSKIRDDLQLGTGETQYHLRRLDSRGIIESRKDGDYRRFFESDRFSEFEQVALGYLRRETPRGMIITLLRSPDTTAGELASELGVSAPTISKYASKLDSAGLLSRDDGYTVERPETLLLLLVRYADSFDADTAELATDADTLVNYDP